MVGPPTWAGVPFAVELPRQESRTGFGWWPRRAPQQKRWSSWSRSRRGRGRRLQRCWRLRFAHGALNLTIRWQFAEADARYFVDGVSVTKGGTVTLHWAWA